MKSFSAVLFLCFLLLSAPIQADVAPAVRPETRLPASLAQTSPAAASYAQDAALIKATFESKLYTLPPYTLGHYGLRLYRQTQDDRYATAVWTDMARVASRLNKFAAEVYTPEQIRQYSQKKINSYRQKKGERSALRYEVTQSRPEYLYLGIGLLGSMARADEYGLKHREDAKLREVIRRYDYSRYATDPAMIRAWAAQLANQVYWLKQLGEQDVVDEFIAAFMATYPDAQDATLSEQQYMNKIYGLTHIIFAASGYYQHPVSEQEFQWIFDYYRRNIDTILARTKEDVIAEVGINFLLAGLASDPVVEKTRWTIQHGIDRRAGMIPSVKGETDLDQGEHRNVLAIMLLDWQGARAVPTVAGQPELFTAVPYGLIPREPRQKAQP
ncbi:DUF3541 domain-containing protein [Photobacterium sp. TY1-4]|uniref:DUF3541 domain-containing protein n=1 Tax=Photobacterium sp. TY1-4 TaxID=2899122 RepID=UPI0021BFF0F8|nr:DUF3541 domain-containing protein [Photobacterium sp. TY1-4]UXI00224.1 DUF3541 domain-containing protein [Photobacterium sp. TY1-4]